VTRQPAPDARPEGTTAKPRTRMTGRERREQLLTVGRRIFAENGYEATTVEEIAEAAGITKPVVYEHFGGKEGLYAVIVDREEARLLERITAVLAAEHPRQAVEQAADAFLGYIEEHPDGFRVLTRDAPIGVGTFASLIGDIAESVTDVFSVHFRARGYPAEHAPVYARALVGMVAMVGEWWLHEREFASGAAGLVRTPSRAQVRAHLVNLSWNGLKDLEIDPHV